jgi:hypothetical protein
MKKLIDKCIELFKENVEGVCDDATPGATDCLSCFQKQYFDGNTISYDCNQKTYIYVARYFPVHVKENAVALKLIPRDIANRLVAENPVNIISIGGGPGSDTFAVKNFLIEKEGFEINTEKDVYLLRIDKEENWNKIAGAVNSRVASTELIKFDARKQLFDITSRKDWPKKPDRLYNIITMSYFLSEMKSNAEIEVIADYINMISSDICSVLIINDRDEEKVHRFKNLLFDKLDSITKFELDNNSRYHCGFFYNDDDRDFISPKLNTNSIRFIKVLFS